MSDLAIRIEGLSKKYCIGSTQRNFDRFGDQLMHIAQGPLRRARKLLRGVAAGAAEQDEIIWALKDVSFEIKHGEVVGIIGRNGAGKSTLLKILSRITEPTEGYADLFGRVGSLLEVGTGFHPELTGRENIYLNGAILGMKKREIERKFDEIIAFAEIDKFIDTPVKHYSSGMYVRLAFSVAAHLESEILLVDEVLAVGDVSFQKKCLGKMGDFAHKGRTVLFVSHNMGLLQAICKKGIFLHNGMIDTEGNISEAINHYMKSLDQPQSKNLLERKNREGIGKIKLVGIEIFAGNNYPNSVLKTGEKAHFVFHLDKISFSTALIFTIFDQLGRPITVLKSNVIGPNDSSSPEIGPKFICEIDQLLLLPGRYYVNVLVRSGSERQDFVEQAATFDVEIGQVNGRPAMPSRKNHVNIFFPHRWILPKTDGLP